MQQTRWHLSLRSAAEAAAHLVGGGSVKGVVLLGRVRGAVVLARAYLVRVVHVLHDFAM